MADAELNTTDTPIAPAAGPVTLDDVRAAIAGTDPNSTNAGAVRKQLGNRGSLSTIQKHLDALRAELVAQALEFNGPAPDAPKELIYSLWAHAWATAQSRTSGALAAAMDQQKVTAQALAVAQADAAAAQQEADEAAQALSEICQQAADAQAEHAVALEAAQTLAAAEQAQLAQELAQLRQELERTTQASASAAAQAQQAAALEKAEHAAAVAALRGEVDRLVNQLADLRAFGFGRGAPATLEAPAAPAPEIHTDI